MDPNNKPVRRSGWIWERLRKQPRKDLDQLEHDLVVGRSEKREFAGDPNQAKHYWVRTRNK